jgi:sec-independent protein translocase protein TatA
MPMGGLELVIILIIILLFFGARRVPELARSFGIGARELKKATSEDADESEAKSETKEASTRDADEAKTKVVPEDAPPPERNGDRAARETRAE